ncbi:MAG: 3-phosphoserine/phosphohydroxythreonine transaminase [Firmicutes bacterium]|nr:3-phosphoserine/phosphohydroxythreonine transaminase [Bacillota bacterium]
MEERVYNFSAGPSQMPLQVLEQAQKDLLCYPGAGASVLEMSHRSKSFDAIIDTAEEDLRKLMAVPDDYAVLFLQGGATTQFSAVCMNLAHQGETMAFIKSGQFAGKAMDEGARWGNAVCVASSADEKYTFIPKIGEGSEAQPFPADAKLLHFTGNNTVFGTTFWNLPQIPSFAKDARLVGDWSSAILGVNINVSDYDLIYAGAQKNIGPAGVTVVILKKELLERQIDPVVPIMLRYAPAAKARSMYNTPPCFSIYVSGLMFKWVQAQGGVAEMERRNREKAGLLYDFIDNSTLYSNPVRKEDRSIMNVVFRLPDDQLTGDFISVAASKGLINLKGHRANGGCRASLYNGMPLEGVKKLIEVMKEFELANR